MKKTLALVLALAMVFSTITVAFAEGALGAEAQTCADLGMLKGSTGTVDAAYVATAPTRIQAAVMFLRLKGLEAEAMAFTGEANFPDADKAAWAKPVMAYLKANPQLGWVGTNGEFNPTGAMTAQAYYKVMLEALGYKQNTAEVVGDFAYADVLTFAASKGLTKVAAVTNFTVNDLAVATVEALNAKVKDGSKTLVASLVEAGKVDKAKAIAAGLYEDAATTTAELENAVAVANNKVELEFSADVAKAFAENAANYKVVAKGSTTALEVKSAVAESGTIVVLETAAQTGGAAYTVTVGSVSKNFAGIAKLTGVPGVDDVVCIDTNTIEVTFDMVMDTATATNVANYSVNNNVTVKAAVLGADRDVVTLTTEGIANNKSYKLTVENVKSADLVAVKKTTTSFTGEADTDAPDLDKVEAAANNVRFTVFFDDDHGVDKASAETIANYTITDGTNTVAIKSITADDADDDDYYDEVEIVTEPLTKGTSYTVKINNIVDGSVSANKMAKEQSEKFRAKAADDDAPTLEDAFFINDTTLWVEFSDDNRLDVATAEDAGNYALNEDMNVVSAKILDAEDLDDADGHVVLLTTSAADEDETNYILTINDVADEFGNVIDADTKEKSIDGIIEDIVPPHIASVEVTADDEVVLTFAQDGKAGLLDKATAEDPTNYYIEGLAVKEADLDSDDRWIVTLTTAKMDDKTAYDIVMNNIKDINGNTVNNLEVSFVANGGVDNAKPEIESIEVVARNLVQVTFNEDVKFSVDAASTTMTVDGPDDDDHVLTAVGTTIDSSEAILFKAVEDEVLAENVEYTVTAITGVIDLFRNAYTVPTDADDLDTIEGDESVNEGPEVESIEQVDAKTIRVVFTEQVRVYGDDDNSGVLDADEMALTEIDYTTEEADADEDVYDEITEDGEDLAFTATVDPDGDANDAGRSTVDLVFANVLEDDNTIGIDFTAFVTDYAGAPAIDEEDEFDIDDVSAVEDGDDYADELAGYLAGFGTEGNLCTLVDTYFDEEEEPEIADVRAKNNKVIEVEYEAKVDEDSLGTYDLEDEDGNDIGITPRVGDEDYIVELVLNGSDTMSEDVVYTLTVSRTAKNMAGNTNSDYNGEEYDFNGSSVPVSYYITGVKQYDALRIRVYSSEILDGKDYTVYKGTVATGTVVAEGTTDADDEATNAYINLTVALVDGATYTVDLDDFGTYVFEADVDDGDLDIEADIVEFSDWNCEDYVVKVVYDEDGDGEYQEDEVYTVTPSDDTDADAYLNDLFDLDGENWIVSGADSGINLSDLPDDAVYTVQVFRTLNAIDFTAAGGVDTLDEYENLVDGATEVEAAPAYTAEFTK